MQKWNVIFLIDQTPPTKIVFLKRGSKRKFAPNMYTGIGGKIEFEETFLESANRELQEESGLTDINLTEFAKVIIDQTDELIYFWGIYNQAELPVSNEGTLEWIYVNQIFNLSIIPTTKEMLKHWQNQDFSNKFFKLHVQSISEDNGIKQVRLINITE
jgi:8-oxo-dGTP pyrophosphatase MutT (NUDIX family)